MGLVALEGIHLWGKHGFYEEERILGTEYILDVYIRTNFDAASRSDDLGKTINYETIHYLVKREMNKPSKLIENIAGRILESLKFQFSNMQGALVRIKKLNPPLKGFVENSFIEVEQNFFKKCDRCKRPLVCYNSKNCWCKDINILPATDSSIKEQFGSCLCSNCLGFYEG